MSDAYLEQILNELAVERPVNPAERVYRPIDESLLTAKIPKTVEEFMELDGLDVWPSHIASEYPIPHDEFEILGAKEIENYLRKTAPLEDQLSALDALDKRINNLEGALKKYAEVILTDQERFSRKKHGVFYSNIDRLFITEAPEEIHESHVIEKARIDAITGALNEKKKKDINFTNFAGFNPKELTELPGQIETPQLLHKVTRAQKFNNDPNMFGFAKFWKRIFLSEASIAIVHDLFWWLFMKIFKPHTQIQQDQLFDRLSDSFAALFFSVNPDIRDKIFKVYPHVLAQTMFMIFYDAFPESQKMYGPIFKEELVGYCWELTTGTKPVPDSWKTWNLEVLQGKLAEADGMVSVSTENLAYILEQPSFDFDSLYKSLENLDAEITKDQGATFEPEKEVKAIIKQRNKIESSYAGESLKFDKVLFDLQGLSPLIAHFLNMKHLRDITSLGKKVRRTVMRSPVGKGKTFREIIREKKALTKANTTKYEQQKKEVADDIAKIQKRNAEVVREINLLKDNVHLFKNAGKDVSHVSAKIASNKPGQSQRSTQLVTVTGEVNLERLSESENSDSDVEQAIEEELADQDRDLCRKFTGGIKAVIEATRKDQQLTEERKQIQYKQKLIRLDELTEKINITKTFPLSLNLQDADDD